MTVFERAPTIAPIASDAPRSASLSRELEVAIAAARHAAEAVMRVYATPFDVSFKDVAHDDPVTAADREANTVIVEMLHAAFPEDAIVAEESPVPEGFEQMARCWFIDPLDGTKEFVARNGEFCVMIGLAIDGRARLGVLAIPALSTTPGEDGAGFLLAGVVGEGCHCIATGGAWQPVSIAPSPADSATATVVVSRSRRPELLDALLTALGGPREVPCGSVGVKVARIVLGHADAYVHPAPCRRTAQGGESAGGTKKWDVCAPEAIVVAAGGAFTDGCGHAIDYRVHELVNRDGLIAAAGPLHSRIVNTLAALVS